MRTAGSEAGERSRSKNCKVATGVCKMEVILSQKCVVWGKMETSAEPG